MQIVKQGNSYNIYSGNVVTTFDKLPAKTYRINFNPQTGYSLSTIHNLDVESKVYGEQPQKVDKVINTFNNSVKNVGVMLSGDKGIGKTLFARMLSQKAIENNIPVIMVSQSTPALQDFIQSIDQESMFLFDEFDKVFNSHKEDLPTNQEELLPVFDGTSHGKKLFVVTLNNMYQISDYLVNRPGRFHYHLRFDYPNAKEVRKFLQDKLDAKYYKEIDDVILFANRTKLNYDCLTAIAFELNMGTTFADALPDLNVAQDSESQYYNVVYKYVDGFSVEKTRVEDDSDDYNYCVLSSNPIQLGLSVFMSDVTNMDEASDKDFQCVFEMEADLHKLITHNDSLTLNAKDITVTGARASHAHSKNDALKALNVHGGLSSVEITTFTKAKNTFAL